MSEYFIGVPASRDMGDKVALVSLICALHDVLIKKKPGVTYYQVIMASVKGGAGDSDMANRLANLCEFFAYGCTKFPDLGVPAKEMPAKIKEIWLSMVPF